ncbi:uncharacterized protein Eint_111540 [Encephalitozoon intestinalis ATCC 50506]|uniref:SUI1 domain-containing protein n=1 Tax=Encephalitozoon intestinalis (strain ATCC 50506) TaxID=876142 RepID=E0SA31_ENCIT|nr:uncharacterized protein Eint_111540 [Encephalitozoon intestinalis ATCC 50506]ADM12653.1 hypothetical protein Eint_111540 [Encephalitozoon intestinalis ATCC 50506]UTX46513.1 eukaryotic translation initiation factor 1 [Encephalitozoon intestinalis]
MGNDITQEKNEDANGIQEETNTVEGTPTSLYGESDIIEEERSIVRVKVQQKKGTKKVTIIENIPKELRESLLSSLKKEMGCGGILLDDKSSIQLQGDKTNMGIATYLKRYIKGCKVELNGRIR